MPTNEKPLSHAQVIAALKANGVVVPAEGVEGYHTLPDEIQVNAGKSFEPITPLGIQGPFGDVTKYENAAVPGEVGVKIRVKDLPSDWYQKLAKTLEGKQVPYEDVMNPPNTLTAPNPFAGLKLGKATLTLDPVKGGFVRLATNYEKGASVNDALGDLAAPAGNVLKHFKAAGYVK